jgi:HD superfamily phosphodiesterase
LKGLKELGVKVDEDCVIAAAICHDVGKPIEWRKGQEGFYSNVLGAGTFYGKNKEMPDLENEFSYQAARHPAWGFHLALLVGMPEHVAHAIMAHSLEGNLYLRTREALIVKEADEIWWEQVSYEKIGKRPNVDDPLKKGGIHKYRKLDEEK